MGEAKRRRLTGEPPRNLKLMDADKSFIFQKFGGITIFDVLEWTAPLPGKIPYDHEIAVRFDKNSPEGELARSRTETSHLMAMLARPDDFWVNPDDLPERIRTEVSAISKNPGILLKRPDGLITVVQVND